MADKSKIQWTEATWNPVVGCSKCSPGCLNCYAEKMANRMKWIARRYKDGRNKQYLGKTDENGKWTGEIECCDWLLDIPLYWHKPRKIFVCSMSDLFHPKVPFEFIDKVMAVISLCSRHTLQILTKRTKRMLEYFIEDVGYGFNRDSFIEGQAHKILSEKYCQSFDEYEQHAVHFPLKNLWLGTSISTQKEADKKIPILLQIPAAVRFVSIEPMLEGISLRDLRKPPDGNGEGWQGKKGGYPYINALTGYEHTIMVGNDTNYKLDWVIVGAESGPKRRPCKIEWIQSIVGQCKAANVKVFVKQIHKDGKLVKMPKEFPQQYPNS